MNKILIALLFTVFSLPCFNSKAQNDSPTPLTGRVKDAIVDSISADYYDWEKVSMSGKLSSPMLPVTASVKIYMVKDELVIMSVSAPLIGEAARIEIDREAALIVNKLSNSYTQILMEYIEPLFPGGMQTIQNLLLGRISIIGSGELEMNNSGLVEIYDSGNGFLTVIPDQDLENSPYVYFYNVDGEDFNLERLLVLSQDEESQVDFDFEWKKKEMICDINALIRNNNLQASVKLNYPDQNPKAISRFENNGKYKEVELARILKM